MRDILIEANCFFNIEKEDETEFPKCCVYGPGNISINCLKYDADKNQYCPFLAFGTAKAALALTDECGNVINTDEFWGGFNLSAEEWMVKEREWIEEQNKKMSG